MNMTKKLKTIIKPVLCYLVFCLLFVGCNEVVEKACKDADKDISLGQTKYKLIGELAPFEEEAKLLLKEKYGITVERIAGCVVEEDQVEYAKAYNIRVLYKLNLGKEDIFSKAVHELMEKNKK